MAEPRVDQQVDYNEIWHMSIRDDIAYIGVITYAKFMSLNSGVMIGRSGFQKLSFPVYLLHHLTTLECEPMLNVMTALPNIGGALCSTPQSLANAHY